MAEDNKMQPTVVDHLQTALTPSAAPGDTKLHITSLEHVEDHHDNLNLAYDNEDDEPELHGRTYVAILAMCVSAFA